MAKQKKNSFGLIVVVILIIILLLRKQPSNNTATTNSQGRTIDTNSGSSSSTGSTNTTTTTTPQTGLTITGVGQTVTGLDVPQTVVSPVRVINLLTNPSGIYSGTATLKTQGGTILHTETISNLNVSSSGPGAYPAIYFDPRNLVWGISSAGTYVMQVSLTIAGTLYSASTNLTITNEDLGIVEGGDSGVSVQDYSIANGNEVTLTLSGGTTGQSTTIQLKQGGTLVGTLTASYSNTMTVSSSAYGYCDVFIDNTDVGGVYIPQQLSGAWTVQKAKAVDENGVLNLTFSKVGNSYIITDEADNSGWANVEYWHNATFLGSTIPNQYAVEPSTDHHLTKKRWGSFEWLGYDNDGLNRQLSQLTFKIVSA